jgi:hypothetical protein
MLRNTNKERRSSPRIDRCGEYFVHPGRIQQEPCILKNISVTGACIVTDASLVMDQLVDLHICRSRDLSLKSQVVWIEGNEYGLSFLLDTPESFNTISFIMNNELHQ